MMEKLEPTVKEKPRELGMTRELRLRDIGGFPALLDVRTGDPLPVQAVLAEDEGGRLYLKVGNRVFMLG